jgi:hypothetical protein
MEMAEGYVTRMALDGGGQVIGYEFIRLGSFLDALRAGKDPAEALQKAIGTYGRFAEAAKYIDPREE